MKNLIFRQTIIKIILLVVSFSFSQKIVHMDGSFDLDGDNDMDLFITVLGGDGPIQLNNNFLMYENTGSSTDPFYELSNENFLGSLDLLSDVIPEFVDIDNDGDLDFFAGQDYTTETHLHKGDFIF